MLLDRRCTKGWPGTVCPCGINAVLGLVVFRGDERAEKGPGAPWENPGGALRLILIQRSLHTYSLGGRMNQEAKKLGL